MSDENAIITMDDMAAVFAVTDDYGVHRESVSVELAKEDPGSVAVSARGVVEITLPVSRAPAEFAADIRAALETRGYAYRPGQIVTADGGGDGADDDGDDADDDGDDADDWLA